MQIYRDAGDAGQSRVLLFFEEDGSKWLIRKLDGNNLTIRELPGGLTKTDLHLGKTPADDMVIELDQLCSYDSYATEEVRQRIMRLLQIGNV